MRKAIVGTRLIAVTALLALIVAIFIYVDRPLEPEEEVVEKTQEAVNTVEVNREPSPSLRSIDEAQIDPDLIGYKKPNNSAMLLEVKELRAKDWLVGDQFSVVIPHTGYVLETQIEEVLELAPGAEWFMIGHPLAKEAFSPSPMASLPPLVQPRSETRLTAVLSISFNSLVVKVSLLA